MHGFLVLVEVAGTCKDHTTLSIVTLYLEFFMDSLHVLIEGCLCVGLVFTSISSTFVLLFFIGIVGKGNVFGEMVLARSFVITIRTRTLKRIN